jgi:hypothetical protein
LISGALGDSRHAPRLRATAERFRLDCWTLLVAPLAAAALLIIASQLVLGAAPVKLHVKGTGRSAVVSIDGHRRRVFIAAPVNAVEFVRNDPHRREYQIDGSDTTNNFTFDGDYFARHASSPYYRFQSLLRDEPSYSRWQNLVIHGPTGDLISRHAHVKLGADFSVPASFDLVVDLHRMEAPRAVTFRETTGAAFQIEINRNDRYVDVSETSSSGTRRLTKFFFPNSWWPPLAEVVYFALRLAALGLILAVLVTAVAAGLPRRSILPADRATWDVSISLIAALVVLAAGAYVSVELFDKAPHVLDAVSYYFQGRTFASGSLAAPAPAVPDAFPTPFTVVHDGKWFSQYPPGTALLLAVGFVLHVPWLIEPMLAAATVALFYGLGRRQYGRKTAVLGTALLASSPFLYLQAGAFLSHVPALFAGTVALYAATRYLENGDGRWAVLSSCAIGFTLLTREITALLYGLPLFVLLSHRVLAQGRRRPLVHLAASGACFFIFAASYALYDRRLTGSLLVSPRHLFNPNDEFGFGNGIGFYGKHTFAAGLVNTDELLTALTIFSFGWPFYAALAPATLPFLLRRTRRWDFFHGALLASFIVAYVFYFYHGIALGPRYYLEALPSLALLTARGFAVLSAFASCVLEKMGRSLPRPRAQNATVALLLILFACNAAYFLPRQLALYKHYAGLPGRDGPRLGSFVRDDLGGRKSILRNALVVTPRWWLYATYFAALNCPRLDCSSVFALSDAHARNEALFRAFHGRTLYVVRERQGTLEARPVRRHPIAVTEQPTPGIGRRDAPVARSDHRAVDRKAASRPHHD